VMRKLLLLAVVTAIGLAIAAYLRRSRSTATTESPHAATFSAPPQRPSPADLPVDPDAPDMARGPGARDVESAATDDTRYDRLVEREAQERDELAQDLRDDPLTERLEADAEPER
jgi:hypothetical protein